MTRTDVRLHQGDFVLVADGGKALLLTNEGTPAAPRLRTLHVVEIDNPPTHEQGVERPGHFDKDTSSRRGAFEAADLHAAAESRFAATIAQMLARECTAAGTGRIMIVAAPRMLGALRGMMSDGVRRKVVAEIDADLTNKPLDAIETLISKH
ncbi:host attachment protein [Acuticoccus sp. M5D2P5]|uniref:baeRF12 domain-containing protein n=1 Tax=Acuticoccus kalidii TaxID=2910977 RepID=UPI001F3B1CE4|nr:host attachment protein [Acuticoccus kalidii]MCF3934872.1 host attachment protein [Acuticoccus kalidii]